jgi:signal transduction histidine kinase
MEDLVRDMNKQLRLQTRILSGSGTVRGGDQFKSRISRILVHEIRTPLNSIIGFTGIILQGLAGPLNKEQEKQLGMVQNSARHLLALINDVLDISKIEAGELNISREPVDVRKAIESVCTTLRKSAEDKGLFLHHDISPDTGFIIGDSEDSNSSSQQNHNNALKFTEQGYVCVISSLWEGDGLHLCFRIRLSE